MHPFSLMQQLASGELGAADWVALTLGHAIAELDLGVAAGHDAALANPTGRPAWEFSAMSYTGWCSTGASG